MDSRQVEPKAIPSKQQPNSIIFSSKKRLEHKCVDQRRFNNQYYCLPDLYKRKYLLCEKLQHTKQRYMPLCNLSNRTNKQVYQELTQWGIILSQIQTRAFEFQEQNKWKIAVRYKLAKKAKRKVVKNHHNKEDQLLYMKCVSHIVTSSFKKDTFMKLIENEQIGQSNTDIFLEEDEEKQKHTHLNEYVKKMAKLNNYEEFESKTQDLEDQIIKSKSIKRNNVFSSIHAIISNKLDKDKKFQQQCRGHLQIYSFLDDFQTEQPSLYISEFNPDDNKVSSFNTEFKKQSKSKKENDFILSQQQEITRNYTIHQIGFDPQKNYENINDVLTLFYKDEETKEADKQQQIQYEILEYPEQNNEPQYYKEPCIDEEYEDFLYQSGGTLEQILYQGQKMMRKMRLQQIETVLEQPMPPTIEARDLFRYKFNYFERDCLFYAYHDKFVPIDSSKFSLHQQHIGKITNPMLPFFFTYYMHKYNSNLMKVNEALSSNIITNNLLFYSQNVCNDLRLLFTQQKILDSKTKFIFNNNICLPQLKMVQERGKYDQWEEQYEEFSKILPPHYAKKTKCKMITNELSKKLTDHFVIHQVKQVTRAPLNYSTIAKLTLQDDVITLFKKPTQNEQSQQRVRTNQEQVQNDLKELTKQFDQIRSSMKQPMTTTNGVRPIPLAANNMQASSAQTLKHPTYPPQASQPPPYGQIYNQTNYSRQMPYPQNQQNPQYQQIQQYQLQQMQTPQQIPIQQQMQNKYVMMQQQAAVPTNQGIQKVWNNMPQPANQQMIPSQQQVQVTKLVDQQPTQVMHPVEKSSVKEPVEKNQSQKGQSGSKKKIKQPQPAATAGVGVEEVAQTPSKEKGRKKGGGTKKNQDAESNAVANPPRAGKRSKKNQKNADNDQNKEDQDANQGNE